jgi:benzoyl-CoA reductase subunit D
MISAGIDCGAKNSKTVILKDGRVTAMASIPTGFDQRKAATESLIAAVQAARISRADIESIGGTGSGQKSIEMADLVVNDVKAIAKAACHLFPSARTVVDVGAEEGRAARIDDTGRVMDFAVNEKCAAGAGAFLEAMARALELSLEEMGSLSLQSKTEIPMNAQCVIFAESEVVGLIHAKTPKPDICRAIHDALSSRIVSMIRRVGLNPDLVMLGGVSRNPGFLEAVRRELKVERILVPEAPEYGAALGAAVIAAQRDETLRP